MPLPRAGRTTLLALALAGCAIPAPPPPGPGPVAPETVDAFSLPPLPPAQPIPREEYARRRAALAAHMDEGVLVVLGAGEPEADYLPFAQGSNFRYLTGVTEPGAALVVSKRGGKVEERIFVRARNPAREVWEGARLGAEGVQRLTGIPAETVDRLDESLASLLAGAGTLYAATALDDAEGLLDTLTPERQVLGRLSARRPELQVVSLQDAVERLRAVKSPAELDLIRRSAYVTALAHRAVMRTIEPGMNEFEGQSLIEYYFRRHGADRPSFATIVGSGPNSTTLHYNAADRFMNAGEVVVMDIGASYRGYAADVTRTVPVSGTFSPEQRAVYEVVLAAQKAAEARVRPGATWQQLSQASDSVLAHGLARLGLIDSAGATYDCGQGRCPQYRIYYMHGLGHGIGLEVHDPEVSYYGPMRIGSAFTIEPGIYVRADALDFLPDTPGNRAMIGRLRPALERYRNIGVRIEDDYIVTAEGGERISAGAPREVEEVEALMRLPGVGEADRRPGVVEWYRQSVPR